MKRIQAISLMLALSSIAPAQIDQGPGGPILVLSSTANPFTRYYAEILRTEGLNEFAVADISAATAPLLAAYDVVILGEMPLTSGQVSLLTGYVSGGGRLICMRPDKQLATLLGLTDASATLAEGYLAISTASPPGAGLTAATMQYHGIADRYTLNGATSVATLYTNATTATTNPAVVLRAFGSGQVSAFTYDLARSVVYIRQGNPARIFGSSIHAGDLFYPDWTDRTKTHIPHADEQMRLLANMILHMNQTRKPLPRFWYLPFGKKMAMIFHHDDHSGGSGGVSGTGRRFGLLVNEGPAGCNVANWECMRSTGNMTIRNGHPYASTLVPYLAQGFDLAIHFDVQAPFDVPQLTNQLVPQINQFRATFPAWPSPASNRNHTHPWWGWTVQPEAEVPLGIRLEYGYDADPYGYYNANPGFFNGSAMVMRFAGLNGSMLDSYLAASTVTDSIGLDLPTWPNPIYAKANGPEGYYGFVTAMIHCDEPWQDITALGIVRGARAAGLPIISARQAMTWLDGRGASAFTGLAWNGSRLNFGIVPGAGTNGLQAMVPVNSVAGPLTSLLQNGTPVNYATQTIKGISYAFFTAAAASYEAVYGTGNPTPTVLSNTPTGTSAPLNTPVTAAFSLPMAAASFNSSTFRLRASGAGADVAAAISASGATATLTPSGLLTPATTYTATVEGSVTSTSGNALGTPFVWSFTTVSPFAVTANTPSGATVPVNTTVTATFNRAPVNVSTANFTLRAAGTGADFAAAVSVAGPVATLAPSALLSPATTYTATIAGAVADTSGSTLGAPVTWTFTTAPALAISSNTPSGTSVPVTTAVTATFNRAPVNVTTANFTLRAGGASSDVAAAVSLSGSVATLTPSAALTGGATYTATMAGTLGDATGSTLGAPATWSFTTAVPAFAVSANAPAGTNVPGNTTVNATFNRAPANVTAANFTLRAAGAGADVPASVIVSGSIATLIPSAALAVSTNYTATIAATVVDSSGNPLAAPVSWTFTTAGAFAITATTPSGTTVALNSTVTALFNRIPIGVSTATFTLRAAGAGPDVTATVNVSGSTATLIPATPLAAGTTYTATMAGTVADQAGLPLGAPVTWTFTTIPPLAVTATTPAGAAVPVSTSVTATFNRPPAGVTTATFTLRAAGAPANVTATVSVSGSTATLTPSAVLAFSTTYTATMAASVADASGLALATPVTWAFTTTPAPFAVTANSPTGANVPINTSITATFSRAPLGVTAATFALRAQGAAADLAATVSVSGAVATLVPSAALANSTIYTLTVSGTVTDTAGLPLGSNFSWSFTTAAVPGAGTVGYWSLNEGAGTVAADTVGGNPATLVSAPAWTTGFIGNALLFNANNGRIEMGSPAALTNLSSFTWSAWVMPTGDPLRGIGPVLEKGSGSAVRKSLSFGPTGSSSPRLVFATVATAGTGARTETVTNSYTVNVWTHWAITYNDAGDRKVRIYKDGVEVAYRLQRAATGTLTSDAGLPLAAGATPASAFYSFLGRIDEIRVHNRALAAAEIQALAALR